MGCLLLLASVTGEVGHPLSSKVKHRERPVVLLPTGYLAFSDGEPFLPLGGFYANWPGVVDERTGRIEKYDLFPCGPSPYRAGFPWPPEVEGLVRRWLKFCADSGVTALRLMLRNMDIVGEVDQVQLLAVKHLFELARPLGIYFDVVLFEDYDKPPYVNLTILEKIALPKYEGRDLSKLPPHRQRFLVERRVAHRASEKYTDPEIIACQKDYLRALIPQLAPEPQIFCYELENEMVDPPMSWVNEMTEFIKGLDPRTLVLGNPGPHEHPVPLLWRESKVDLFSYHPYSDGLPFADHGAVVYTRSKWAAMSGKPRFTGEGGINQNRWQKGVRKVPPEYAVRGVRDQIWLTLTNGECGAFLWAPEVVGEVLEFGKAKEVMAQLDLKTLHRKRPDVGLVIPDSLPPDKSRPLCIKWAWLMLSRGLDFDFLTGPDPDYKLCIAVDTPPEKLLHSLPESPLKPTEGYQLSSLFSRDGGQILAYLRNIAGGIRDMGDGRPCWLRHPSPADAGLSFSLEGSYTVLPYDLDEGRWLPRREVGGRGLLLVGRGTTHDFVLIFKRRRG